MTSWAPVRKCPFWLPLPIKGIVIDPTLCVSRLEEQNEYFRVQTNQIENVLGMHLQIVVNAD